MLELADYRFQECCGLLMLCPNRTLPIWRDVFTTVNVIGLSPEGSRELPKALALMQTMVSSASGNWYVHYVALVRGILL